MAKRCAICDSEISEEYDKLKGTQLKIVEEGKKKFIYVCSECQKVEGWIEKAKVRSA